MSGAEPALLAAGAGSAGTAGAAGAGLGAAGAGLTAAEVSGIPAVVASATPAAAATGGLSGLQIAGLGAAGSSALSAFQKGATATPADGFSLDAGPAPSVGPIVNAPAGYGAPSFIDKTMDYVDRFTGGMKSNMGQAYKAFGNNPETYGYAAQRLGDLLRTAPGAPPPPVMNTTIYQQSPNSYGRRY